MFLWFVAPLPAFAFNRMRRKPMHILLVYALTLITGFVLAVSAAWMADQHLAADLRRLDLNSDGGIDGIELTAEAQEVMDNWANDTGRTMVFVTGIPLSAIWYAVCFSVLGALTAIISMLRRHPPDNAIYTLNSEGRIQNESHASSA